MPKTKTRKRPATRVHTVSASLSVASLTKAGSALTLILESQGLKIGEIQIGRGGLFWWGRHRKTRKRISWSRFADLMDDLAYSH